MRISPHYKDRFRAKHHRLQAEKSAAKESVQAVATAGSAALPAGKAADFGRDRSSQ